MANFRDLNSNFTKNIDREIQRAFNDAYWRETAAEIVKQIQVRTRSGFGVVRNNDRQRRLRPLSEGYKETRQFARSIGLLSNSTTPNRSNLTFTGRMLESINYSLTRHGLRFGFNNQEATRVAEEVQSRGRPFFNLSSTEIRNLTRKFNLRLRGFLVRI